MLIFIFLSGCSADKSPLNKQDVSIDYDIIVKDENKIVSYTEQVKPILESRCVVCHGCYDAPCQLKLTSFEAISRGANPQKVYDAERIFADEPTRMFIDAHTEDEWRSKGFHSVLTQTETDPVVNLQHSVLYKMLRLKQLNPQPRTGKINHKIDLSLNREQSCPTNDEFDEYAEKFPMQGMPFAMPNLTDDEYHILVKWIAQGAPIDSRFVIEKNIQKNITNWEIFFNKTDMKSRLVSRYIYEHLFSGHLHFKGNSQRQFFRLVRSYTPSGEPIKEIATVRAFDDPGVAEFYYRLKLVKSSIVDKSHIVYELSEERMRRYKELFYIPKYAVESLPGYEPDVASNPIKAFISLPVKSRYQFLLDDAKYFIEGFIKGPVCRGQVALNVIEDNFWVFFTDPDRLIVNKDNHYLDAMAEQLKLPAAQGNTLNILSIWTDYWQAQHEYMQHRQKHYKELPRMDLDQAMNVIWDGQGSMNKDNRALTVFRHFDSASVTHGLIGDYPETAWVLDYPILERIHYLLVAGYDVYGNIGHQLNTRLYMDFLRMEGENTFLAFLPIKQRKQIRDSWYVGIREDIQTIFQQPADWLNVQIVFGFETDDPQREFYQKLEKKLDFSPDNINRCYNKKCSNTSALEKYLQKISSIRGSTLSVFPDVSLLRINTEKQSHVYTLIKNKAYKNISFILSSVDDRARDYDSLSIYKGVLGSYPNFFFTIDQSELESFTDQMIKVHNVEDYEKFVGKYGVRRTSSQFWEIADWFNEQYEQQSSTEYGILDLYRYKNR